MRKHLRYLSVILYEWVGNPTSNASKTFVFVAGTYLGIIISITTNILTTEGSIELFISTTMGNLTFLLIYIGFFILILLKLFTRTLVKIILNNYSISKTSQKIIEDNTEQYINQAIKDRRSDITWNEMITLESSSRSKDLGWLLKDVEFILDESFYTMPNQFKADYERYLKDEFEKDSRRRESDERISIPKFPSTSSDMHVIKIDVIRNMYSYFCFFSQKIYGPNQIRRKNVINSIFAKEVDFQEICCSLVLHPVVVTTDSKILITKISPRNADVHRSWAVSFGEQMSYSDFFKKEGHSEVKLKPDSILLSWINRALMEELGIDGRRDLNINESRLMAFAMEANAINFSLICFCKLNMSSLDLDVALKNRVNFQDDEILSWQFIGYKEIPKLILNLKENKYGPFHPSSGLRLLWAAIRIMKIDPFFDELAKEAGLKTVRSETNTNGP